MQIKQTRFRLWAQSTKHTLTNGIYDFVFVSSDSTSMAVNYVVTYSEIEWEYSDFGRFIQMY